MDPNAPIGDIDNVRLKCIHALGNEFGEYGAAVQSVHGRISRGERLCATVTELKAAGKPSVVSIEQNPKVGREVLDPAGCFGQ